MVVIHRSIMRNDLGVRSINLAGAAGYQSVRTGMIVAYRCDNPTIHGIVRIG